MSRSGSVDGLESGGVWIRFAGDGRRAILQDSQDCGAEWRLRPRLELPDIGRAEQLGL